MDDQRSRALQAMIISLCTVLGLVLRIVIFPHGLSPMETDEAGYLSDGLQIIEGVTSGHKYAPSGPLTWFGTLYAGGGALLSLIPGDPDVFSGFPTLLRPVAALEASLFRLYSDMSGMRLAAVSLIVVLMVISIAGISRFGYRIAGPLGALVAAAQTAAHAAGVTLHSLPIRGPEDFKDAFDRAALEQIDGAVILSSPLILERLHRSLSGP
jgi:hypothetical protein